MSVLRGVYAICDNTTVPRRSHPLISRQLLEGGVRIIQLRLKGGDPGRTAGIAGEILKLKRDFDFTFIVNDDVELAVSLGADGVHLGRDDRPVSEVRALLGSKILIGYSAHSREEALAAERSGADYVALGAIYPTPFKGPDHPIQGLERLSETVRAVSIPVVAIGGIDRGNFSAVVKTGVAAVAMIRALVAADDIAREARWFVEAFDAE